MNLTACGGLARRAEASVWYRAINPQFHSTALRSAHTKGARSRFSGGPMLPPPRQFEILYLAQDSIVAAFEYGALFGSVSGPFGYVPNPRRGYVILNVQVYLQEVADLTDLAGAQQPLDTTAQELTGDWDGYGKRGWAYPVPLAQPTGLAPTQELGEALYRTGIEGFRSISARVPTHCTLMVFPQNLRPGSNLEYRDSDGIVVARVPEP